MLYGQVNGTGLRVSKLGFGCAPLLGRASRKESLSSLGTAYELGITFFDTARSYGYGESEALLGEFLQGKRAQVSICTKFGILPSRQTVLKQIAKPIVRGFLSLAPNARKLVQKGVRTQLQAGQFSLTVLRNSVEESLRKLRTDYVDILLVHSATREVLDNHELLREMENLTRDGKARAVGISADLDVVLLALKKNLPMLSVMQFPCNPFDLSATKKLMTPTERPVAFMANHPFGGAVGVEKLRTLLRSVTGLPNIDDRLLASATLNLVLQGTNILSVIPAMIQKSHIETNVAAIENSYFSDSDIDRLRSKLLSVKPSKLE